MDGADAAATAPYMLSMPNPVQLSSNSGFGPTRSNVCEVYRFRWVRPTCPLEPCLPALQYHKNFKPFREAVTQLAQDAKDALLACEVSTAAPPARMRGAWHQRHSDARLPASGAAAWRHTAPRNLPSIHPCVWGKATWRAPCLQGASHCVCGCARRRACSPTSASR